MIRNIQVKGAARLAATLNSALAALNDLPDAPDEAGRVVAGLAHATAPRRTGTLASSVTATRPGGSDVDIGSDLVYAPVIHNGWAGHGIAARPFLADALRRSQGKVLAVYAADVGRQLDTVEGA